MRARIAIAGLACTATARLDYGLNPDLSGCSAVATSSNFQCMSSIEAVVRSTASWNKQVQYEQPTTDAWIDRCIETSAIGLPFALIPVVYAQAPSPTAAPQGHRPEQGLYLAGMNGVINAEQFTDRLLALAQKYLHKLPGSPLRRVPGLGPAATHGSDGSSSSVSAPAQAASLSAAEFFAYYDAQPVDFKAQLVADLLDVLVAQAAAAAEAQGLAVGLLGAGAGCYAVLGWWSDALFPGVGTVACSVAAGALGHQRAKHASARMRSRFVSEVLDHAGQASTPSTSNPTSATSKNAFVEYLAASTADQRLHVVGSVQAAQLMSSWFSAVQHMISAARSDGEAAAQVVMAPMPT